MQPNHNALKVLAVGAARPSASLVVPELLKRKVSVRAFVHKQEDEPMVRKLGVTDIVVGELSNAADIAKAVKGMDAVFYIAPASLEDEAEVGKRFVAAAKQAGVRRVVFSSVIHPVLSELVNHADNAPVEEALLDSGMEYVFLQPAMLFQNFVAGWAKTKESGVYGEPWSTETRFTRVDYRDVAEVAAIALTEDRLLYGTFELCAEGNMNRHDLAALISEVLGKHVKPIKIELPAQANVPPKLTRMFNWYDKHALLGNSKATGRKNLIMGGVTTDICLVFPSISAVQLGYSVQAILDASGSSWTVQEDLTRQRMQQAGVVLTTTNTAIAELVQDWASPAGSELIQLLIGSAPMMQPAS